jgi:hypothetical protein
VDMMFMDGSFGEFALEKKGYTVLFDMIMLITCIYKCILLFFLLIFSF